MSRGSVTSTKFISTSPNRIFVRLHRFSVSLFAVWISHYFLRPVSFFFLLAFVLHPRCLFCFGSVLLCVVWWVSWWVFRCLWFIVLHPILIVALRCHGLVWLRFAVTLWPYAVISVHRAISIYSLVTDFIFDEPYVFRYVHPLFLDIKPISFSLTRIRRENILMPCHRASFFPIWVGQRRHPYAFKCWTLDVPVHIASGTSPLIDECPTLLRIYAEFSAIVMSPRELMARDLMSRIPSHSLSTKATPPLVQNSERPTGPFILGFKCYLRCLL